MAVSQRHLYMQQQAAKVPAPLYEYEVLDPYHQPDLNGELAGGKVYRRQGKEFVMLTEAQAQFYLDSASIKAATPTQ